MNLKSFDKCNKQLNNTRCKLSEKEMNMRALIVQEYLHNKGELVTPFTLIKLNEIYNKIDYSTKCKLYKKVKGWLEDEY